MKEEKELSRRRFSIKKSSDAGASEEHRLEGTVLLLDASGSQKEL